MIYILTGPVRSGKTSALLNWCYNRIDVDGVLCPDNDNGRRYFLMIKSKEILTLEVEDNSINKKDIISIGPFHFLKKAFNIANEYLIHLKDNIDYSYLIIDELGKLELKNEGLFSAAKHLIPYFKKKENKHLILIIRESLVDDIIKHYSISDYKILKNEDFGNLN